MMSKENMILTDEEIEEYKKEYANDEWAGYCPSSCIDRLFATLDKRTEERDKAQEKFNTLDKVEDELILMTNKHTLRYAQCEELKRKVGSLSEAIKQANIHRSTLGKQRNAFKFEVIKLRNDLEDMEVGDQNIRLKDAKVHREKINKLKEENENLNERVESFLKTIADNVNKQTTS
jgi:anaerobic ribonucleoside-triphosphate reductase